MQVRPFKPDDLRQIDIQPAQRGHVSYLTDEMLEAMAGLDAFTALVNDRPVMIGGLVHFWPGRAMAWSYLSASAGRHLAALTRATRRFLDLQVVRRLEMYVDDEFEAGHRWARLLGFNLEAKLEAFRPDGGDQCMYVRIRHD